MKGVGIYFILLLAVTALFYYLIVYDEKPSEYTYANFLYDLEQDNIKEIDIYQNKEIPTGKLKIVLESGEKYTIYIEDINSCTKDILEKGKSYQLHDVERDIIIWEILPCRNDRNCFCIYFHDYRTRWRWWRRKDDEFRKEPREDGNRYEQAGNV
jgi:hypothetical protein